MSKYKIRIDYENEPIIKSKFDDLDECDSIFNTLKKKMRGSNK